VISMLPFLMCVSVAKGDGSAAISMEITPRSDAYSDGGSSLINKPVSYRDFVELWKHLLNPDKIKVCLLCALTCVRLHKLDQ